MRPWGGCRERRGGPSRVRRARPVRRGGSDPARRLGTPRPAGRASARRRELLHPAQEFLRAGRRLFAVVGQQQTAVLAVARAHVRQPAQPGPLGRPLLHRAAAVGADQDDFQQVGGVQRGQLGQHRAGQPGQPGARTCQAQRARLTQSGGHRYGGQHARAVRCAPVARAEPHGQCLRVSRPPLPQPGPGTQGRQQQCGGVRPGLRHLRDIGLRHTARTGLSGAVRLRPGHLLFPASTGQSPRPGTDPAPAAAALRGVGAPEGSVLAAAAVSRVGAGRGTVRRRAGGRRIGVCGPGQAPRAADAVLPRVCVPTTGRRTGHAGCGDFGARPAGPGAARGRAPAAGGRAGHPGCRAFAARSAGPEATPVGGLTGSRTRPPCASALRLDPRRPGLTRYRRLFAAPVLLSPRASARGTPARRAVRVMGRSRRAAAGNRARGGLHARVPGSARSPRTTALADRPQREPHAPFPVRHRPYPRPGAADGVTRRADSPILSRAPGGNRTGRSLTRVPSRPCRWWSRGRPPRRGRRRRP